MALKKIILNGTEIELPSGGGGGNVPTKTSELTNDSGFITSEGTAAKANQLTTVRVINGVPFNGTANVNNFVICNTAAATTDKTISIDGFRLISGSQVRVKFSNANTASAPTLNMGRTGAKRMSYKGNLITNANFSFDVNKIYTFTYDGTNWVIEGDWDSAKKQDTLVSGTNIKTINGQSVLGSGNITVQGGGSSEGGSSAYAEVNHGTSDSTFTLTPNTFHVWDEVAELNLSLGAETSGVANEYLFQFTSGSEPTTLALPDNLKWANDSAPTIASNMIYQVSILKGLASVLEFSDEATGGSIFPVTLQVGDNGGIGILVYDALVAGAVLNSGDLTFEDDGKTFDVTEYSVDYEGIYLAGYEDGPMKISYYLRQSGELYKEQM